MAGVIEVFGLLSPDGEQVRDLELQVTNGVLEIRIKQEGQLIGGVLVLGDRLAELQDALAQAFAEA